MKKLLLAASILALHAGSATAQDTVYGWSGAYVGVQAGYGWGSADADLGSNGHIDYSPEGIFGGAYAGFNHQLANRLVLGVEVDATAGDVSSTSKNMIVTTTGVLDESQFDYSIGVRGRVGYAVGRFLPYVAAGAAFGRYYHGIYWPEHDFDLGEARNVTGWTAGGGLEYAATDNLVARLEYRYTDFGREHFDDWVKLSGDVGGFIEAHSLVLRTHDVRFGIAYKF